MINSFRTWSNYPISPLRSLPYDQKEGVNHCFSNAIVEVFDNDMKENAILIYTENRKNSTVERALRAEEKNGQGTNISLIPHFTTCITYGDITFIL